MSNISIRTRKKIISDLAKVKFNIIPYLKLGNIYAKRDWGYSMDYVEAMWKMMQQKKPEDYVISSGATHTVKTFVNKAAKKFDLDLIWKGKGLKEHAINIENKKVIIECRKRYFRPLEVDYLKGDALKAKRILEWTPKISIDNLIDEMIQHELKNIND